MTTSEFTVDRTYIGSAPPHVEEVALKLSNAEARLAESEGSVHHLRSLLNGIYGKVGAEATKRTVVVVEVGAARTNKDVS